MSHDCFGNFHVSLGKCYGNFHVCHDFLGHFMCLMVVLGDFLGNFHVSHDSGGNPNFHVSKFPYIMILGGILISMWLMVVC